MNEFLGSPETNVDTDENRHDFIDKFQRLKQQLLDGTGQETDNDKSNIIIAQTIFTSDTNLEKTITVGNWTLQCDGPEQIQIHNVEGKQVRLYSKTCIYMTLRFFYLRRVALFKTKNCF